MKTVTAAMDGAVGLDHFLYEERSGIIEVCCKVSREKAEQMARQQLWEARHKENNAPLFNR